MQVNIPQIHIARYGRALKLRVVCDGITPTFLYFLCDVDLPGLDVLPWTPTGAAKIPGAKLIRDDTFIYARLTTVARR